MRRQFTCLFMLLLCLLCASACGTEPRPLPPWPTPVPQSYTPVQAHRWEDYELRTICLAVDQRYDFGEFWSEPIPEELYEDQPIQLAIQESLELLGLEIVDAGSACDATLSVAATFTPLGAYYQGSGGGHCWGGARLDLEASLAAPERPRIACPTTIINEPADALRSCLAREDAPFISVWQEALSESMICLFGSQAHCPMLIQVWNRPMISVPREGPLPSLVMMGREAISMGARGRRRRPEAASVGWVTLRRGFSAFR